ncbi:restriction endonuclease [Candidatus Margulisiibacteriota bacterium]
MVKKGQSLEKIITHIQSVLGESSTVKWNDSLPDKDTGKYRQVDVSIRTNSPSGEILTIVEVRDKTTPVGVGYIEEVNSKRDSVLADVAVIVSSSGFTKSAITKANKYNIRIYTYEEAIKDDWSKWLQCKNITYYKIRKKMCYVNFIDHQNQSIDDGNYGIIRKSDEKVILNEQGFPFCALDEITRNLIHLFRKDIINDAPYHDGTIHKIKIDFRGDFKPNIYIKSKDSALEKICRIIVEIDISIKKEEVPLHLMRFQKHGESSPSAEVAYIDFESDGEQKRLNIIKPHQGNQDLVLVLEESNLKCK